MWNDNDTHIDLIDVNYLVDGVKSIVENDNLIPCTIGVFGDWGSGKSSLMKMIESEYEDDDETLVIQFNGWLFEGYDDAKTALMTTIVEQVVSKRTLTAKAKGIAKNLIKQIDWLKVAKYTVAHGLAYATTGGIGNVLIEMQRVAGTSASDVAEGVKSAVKGFSDGDYDNHIDKLSEASSQNYSSLQTGIRDFHKGFGDLLNETKIKRLLVFIDDLDRCTPDTIIATLEAIKLFLFIDNSAFIISADERLIKYAVRRRFPEIPGDASEVGRDYLEKLIQFPLRIPSLSESEMESYVNLLFASIHLEDGKVFEKLRKDSLDKRSADLFGAALNSSTISEFLEKDSIPDELIEDLGLSAQIIPVLSTGLNGNPRQCKRFLNTLLMRFQMAKTRKIDLKKRVLAKLMLLEYFKPETFRVLSGLQNRQDGSLKELEKIETVVKNKEVDDKNADEKALTEDLESWLSDGWLVKWFNSEPSLSSLDLRPYFFFSRDKLSALGTETSRMSSQAEQVYQKLISGSKAENRSALVEVGTLSSIDAAAVFNALTQSARQEDDETKRAKILKSLCGLGEKRTELLTELISFFRTFPTSNLTVGIVPQFIQAINKTQHEVVGQEIIKAWSKSENNAKLAQIASKKVK